MIGLRFFVLSAKALCAFAQLLPPCHRVTETNQMRYKTTKTKKSHNLQVGSQNFLVWSICLPQNCLLTFLSLTLRATSVEYYNYPSLHWYYLVWSSIVCNSATVQSASKIHCLLKWLFLWQNYLIDLIEQERPVEEADIAVKISAPGFSSQTVVEGRHQSNLVLDIFVFNYIDWYVRCNVSGLQ